jgi:hypothetical protein
MHFTISICLVAFLCSASAKEASSCHGLQDCGCRAEKGELKSCTKNVQVMYLHNVSNQHQIYAIAQDAFYMQGRVKEL